MASGISLKFRLVAIVAMAVIITGIIRYQRESPRRPAGSDAPAVLVAKQPEQSKSPTLATPQPPRSKPSLFSAPAVPQAATPVPTERPAGMAQRSPSAPPASSVATPASPRARTSPGDPMASDAERRSASIEADKVSLMLRDYRSRMGENPVGTNSEIMKAVMGGNPKGARLGPPEGQSLNGNGELVDAWGTPYFFHQISRNDMEIRSAGPDRTLYTEDDVIGH